MKLFKQLKFSAVSVLLFLFVMGCNQASNDKISDVKADNSQDTMRKTDPAKLKEEIQAVETAMANADNARDAKAVAAFYSDDAVTLDNNRPMAVGRAAIEKSVETSLAKKTKGVTTAYEAMDVFGCDNYATEVGKITQKDADGETTYTGKYMALWEKRDGKWICIRDIANDDVKGK
jgi:uncharacterized protein (TIGR02246 family)